MRVQAGASEAACITVTEVVAGLLLALGSAALLSFSEKRNALRVKAIFGIGLAEIISAIKGKLNAPEIFCGGAARIENITIISVKRGGEVRYRR